MPDKTDHNRRSHPSKQRSRDGSPSAKHPAGENIARRAAGGSEDPAQEQAHARAPQAGAESTHRPPSEAPAREEVRRSPGPRNFPYAELRCKSNFSFLEGASHPEELAERAAALGLHALAITDRNTLAGVVRMHCAAKAAGLKLIVGAEIAPVDAPPILLYAPDRAAYGRIARIISEGRLRAEKGSCRITLEDVARWSEGLMAAAVGKERIKGSTDQWINGSTYQGIKTSKDQEIKREDGGSESSRPRLEIGDTRSAISCSASCPAPSEVRHSPSALRVHDSVFSVPHSAFVPHSTFTLAHSAFAISHSVFLDALLTYRDIFGDRLYLTAGVHGGPDDEAYLARMDAYSRCSGVPLLAVNDVHYHQPDRRFLQDVLTCIREGCVLDQAGERLFANAERHLKSGEEMARLFAAYPQAVARTVELADRCTFSLDELCYEYPEAIRPPEESARDYLARLTWEGAARHYPQGVPQRVRSLIEHELELIGRLGYEPYFLTVHDIVRFARSRDILCQGRGSAANSAVCYCLGITCVDPDQVDLLFERFVSAERNEPPDIDVDFEHERREEVFQYIYEKYGRDHAGIVAEVITYRPRSAIRDVGKALGLSLDRIGALAKKHEWWDKVALPEDLVREVGFDPGERTLRLLGRLVRMLLGFPRHLSQHVGGFVITRGPLHELVPIGNGAMPDRTFIEWDKDDIDALGILKIDCLALGMLTAIHKCMRLMRSSRLQGTGNGEQETGLRKRAPGYNGGQRTTIPSRLPSLPGHRAGIAGGTRDAVDQCGRTPVFTTQRINPQHNRRNHPVASDPDHSSPLQDCISHSDHSVPCSLFPVPSSLTDFPPTDPAVFDMICRADTVGVFQIESRAQMSMLPRLRPRCYYDLVIEVAIVRPGPIQGGMVHPYLRRRTGQEEVTYPSEGVRQVLERTLGVPLFQEQAMKLAVVAAGFTPGEADRLRRAMGAWRRHGEIERFRDKLISGMLAHGLTREYAERCFEQICGFGEYGFPESHAASFAQLVYVSAWLKRYHPAAFCAAVINSQPMGFYQPAQLVRDAREHGVTVRPIDVNASGYDCRLEEATLDEGRPGQAPRRSDEATEGTEGEQEEGIEGSRDRGIENSHSLLRVPHSAFSDDPSAWGLDGPAVRLGMRLIKGVSAAQVEGIERAQTERAFTSVADLARRSGAARATLARLAAAGAMGSLGLNRREALWHVLALDEDPPLFEDMEPVEARPQLPPLSPKDEVYADYETFGLSLQQHPMALIREELARLRARPTQALRESVNGTWIRVAGLVLVRQRPSTALGIIFCTLEDETGTANLVIRPTIYDRYRKAARAAVALIAEGRAERQGDVIHLQVYKLEDVSEALATLRSVSRDFH